MKKLTISLVLAGILVSACQSPDPYTDQQRVNKTTWGSVIGAAGGAAVGLLTGDNAKERRQHALVGALGGAVVGGGVGYYMDRQEAALRKELVEAGVRVARNGDNIDLIMPGNITFATNSADIKSSFYQTLDAVAKVFKEYNKTQVIVSGHTDNVGGYDHNKRLSLSRAQSVADYLAARGVNPARFAVEGRAYDQPVASNSNEAGRQQNRRVELRIAPVGNDF